MNANTARRNGVTTRKILRTARRLTSQARKRDV
jgi:hypothetical protein